MINIAKRSAEAEPKAISSSADEVNACPQADRSGAHARVVLGQQVPGEVAAQVSPHGVDVIGLVLGVVVLDEQARTADRVMVARAWLDRPGPSEAHLVGSGVGDDKLAAQLGSIKWASTPVDGSRSNRKTTWQAWIAVTGPGRRNRHSIRWQGKRRTDACRESRRRKHLPAI
jgi:hypothetical protein